MSRCPALQGFLRLDEAAVATAYQEGLSLRECAMRFGTSERRVAGVLERQNIPRRSVGRPAHLSGS